MFRDRPGPEGRQLRLPNMGYNCRKVLPSNAPPEAAANRESMTNPNTHSETSDLYCVFCEIVAGREPARIRYLDNDIIAIVNRLTWVPIMLLVMPRRHMSQLEMWSSDMMTRLGDVAATLGCMYCPNGFRILSNFGYDGLQSQSHGHLHVIGGQYLGHYA